MPEQNPIRSVTVFCASAEGAFPLYRMAAEELGRALGRRGIDLVYGGAKLGLMAAVANAALQAGGRVIGVIPQVLVELEAAHQGLTELHITSTMHTRKAMMAERADAFIALPGGVGTLEELFEVIAWQTLKLHAKPIILLNTNSFYDPLLAFLNHAQDEGMIKPQVRKVVLVSETVDDLFRQLGVV